MLDETLRNPATLYRSARRAIFDPKPTIIRVLDMSGGPYATPTVLGTADFDLAEHAELTSGAAPKSKQLRLPRVVRRGDPKPDASILVQMSITSRWVQGASGASDSTRESASACCGEQTNALDAAESTASGASSSLASSALTHEALQAFEKAGGGSGGGVTSGSGGGDRSQMRRSQSFGRQVASARGGKDASRVAELSQLVAGAAADARQAESRLATLQFRLRTEVRRERPGQMRFRPFAITTPFTFATRSLSVPCACGQRVAETLCIATQPSGPSASVTVRGRGVRGRQVLDSTREALEKCKDMRKADDLAKAQHQQLVLVMDQVRGRAVRMA